jgi:D-sedoheptulose 7-phosphate isomerase
MKNSIKNSIQESIKVKEKLLTDAFLLEKIEQVAQYCVTAFQKDKKLFFCGNGGSAADAQHLAAELSGRFYKERKPLYAEALHVNTSFLTAVANDYGYDDAYRRMVEAVGREGDILIAISTSGNSQNILNALAQAKIQGMTIVGMTGETGGKMKEQCDVLLNMPSTDTPRIQEAHILVGHILCELIEEGLFSPTQPSPKGYRLPTNMGL